MKGKQGLIVSCLNNKGGVGKTTLACNLSHALTRLEKKVLVIDADTQCNTTSVLLSNQKKIPYSLADVLEAGTKKLDVEKCVYPTLFVRLFCLPNYPETSGLEPELIANAPESFMRLKKRLRGYIDKNFDYAFIDLPPNMGSFVLSSLFLSDCAIIPVEVDSSFSLEGLKRALDLIEEIQNEVNPDLKFLRLLINKVDRRTKIYETGFEQINETVKPTKIFKTTIPINADFKKAERAKTTILSYAGSATGAKAFRELAQEFLEVVKKESR